MPPKAQKSKAAKLLAAMSASKSKGGKKKWSKGKVREKKNYRVVLNKALYDKIIKEVPKKSKVITVYNLVENYKINGSVARWVIRELLKQRAIRPVALHSDHQIYTRVEDAAGAAGADAGDKKEGKGGAKPKKGGKGAAADGDKAEKPEKAKKGGDGDKGKKPAPKKAPKAAAAAADKPAEAAPAAE